MWLLMRLGLIKPMRPLPPSRTGFGPWVALGAIGFVESLWLLGWWGVIPAVVCLIGGFWLDDYRRR